MMLVHAFGGCDTTSAVYEQVKLSILQLLEKSKAVKEEADVLLQKNRTPVAIGKDVLRIFLML